MSPQTLSTNTLYVHHIWCLNFQYYQVIPALHLSPKSGKTSKLYTYTCPLHFSNIKPTKYIATDLVFKVRDNLFHKMVKVHDALIIENYSCG